MSSTAMGREEGDEEEMLCSYLLLSAQLLPHTGLSMSCSSGHLESVGALFPITSPTLELKKPHDLQFSVFWLVKACLIIIIIFFLFPSYFCCIDFLVFNNFMPQSGHSEWKGSFLYPVTSFGETSRAWLSSRRCVSVRCCWIWKGQNPREAEAAQSWNYRSVSVWRQSVASLRKKHFIKNASPVPASLPLFNISYNKDTHYCPWGFS